MKTRLRLLLIEDNPDDRVLIKRGLNKGFKNLHIEEVLNQKQLDDAVSKGEFDIVITDYRLGWTDGIKILITIKAKWPECPVIMMTVMDTEEIAIDAMEAGLDDYVVKSPSQFALLADIVRSALEQKEQEQALQEAEIRYKELFDSVPVGLYRTKFDGQIVSVNQAMVDILGYPDRQTLIETNSKSVYVNPDERSSNLEEATEKGFLRKQEHDLYKYDGEIITVEMNYQVIRNEAGEINLLDGYLEDITERKRVEEALSHIEMLNKNIVESVQEGVFLIDHELRYVVWNEFMERLSGLKAADVIGKGFLEFDSEFIGKEVEQHIQRVFFKGKSVHTSDISYPIPQTEKTGWIEAWYDPIISPSGEVIGVVGTIHEITQRKENENQREKLLAAERKRARELASLTLAATTISSNLDITKMLQVVAKELVQLVNIDSCAISTWDPEANTTTMLVEHALIDIKTSPNWFDPVDVDQWPNMKKVLVEGIPVQVNISEPDLPKTSKKYLKDEKVKSLLMIPLISQNETIGLVELEDFSEIRTFNDHEIGLAQMLCNQAANALENARLFHETTEALEREQTLNEITHTINIAYDLRQSMERIGQLASGLVGADAAGISLQNPDEPDTYDNFFYNAPENAPEMIVSKEKGLMWEVIESRESVLINDYSGHPMASSFWVEVGIHGSIIVPFISGDVVIGILGVFSKDPNKQFTQRDLELIESVGQQTGLAIRNTSLFDETKRRSNELLALYDIALATAGVLDTPTLLKELQNKVDRLLEPDGYGVYLYDQESNKFEAVMALESDDQVEEAIGVRYTMEPEGFIGWVMENHEPLLIHDVNSDDLPVAPKNLFHSVQSWLGVPLISRDKLIGAITVQSFKPNAFDFEDTRFLESLGGQVAMALENARLYEELEDAFVQTVLALANAIEMRDSYTIDHGHRMASWAEETGRLMGISESDLETLRWAALLHDIGKIGVPDDILLKPATLTEKEYEVVRRHPAHGASIVEPVKKLKDVAPIIRHHQEKYDGTGYPDGLAGEEIPLGARILMVVDSYVAITDDRVYRKARSHEYAVKEIKKHSGKQYDPSVVRVFLGMIEDIQKSDGNGASPS